MRRQLVLNLTSLQNTLISPRNYHACPRQQQPHNSVDSPPHLSSILACKRHDHCRKDSKHSIPKSQLKFAQFSFFIFHSSSRPFLCSGSLIWFHSLPCRFACFGGLFNRSEGYWFCREREGSSSSSGTPGERMGCATELGFSFVFVCVG